MGATADPTHADAKSTRWWQKRVVRGDLSHQALPYPGRCCEHTAAFAGMVPKCLENLVGALEDGGLEAPAAVSSA